MLDPVLGRIERDLATGSLHLLLLVQIGCLQPIHGYGLIKSLVEAAGGRDSFKEGTIYPLLAGLEREGIIQARWGQPSTGPRRKYYSLTPQGRQALRFAVEEWSRLRTMIDSVIHPPQKGTS